VRDVARVEPSFEYGKPSEPPTARSTYSLPFTSYTTGASPIEVPTFVDHSTLPFAAFIASNTPLSMPPKARPPPVVMRPPVVRSPCPSSVATSGAGSAMGRSTVGTVSRAGRLG
jgi:hypothetical protein